MENLKNFYENLEDKSNGLRRNLPMCETQKENMQMELEKIFMQLRGCLNDVVNIK